jgi:hypothetical protein
MNIASTTREVHLIFTLWELFLTSNLRHLWTGLEFSDSVKFLVKVGGKVSVILPPTVSRPVCFCVTHPFGTHDRFFLFFLTLCLDNYGLFMWAVLSEVRSGLLSSVVAGPRQHSLCRESVPGTHDHILLSRFWDSPKLEGQVPAIISFWNGIGFTA